MNKKYVLKTPKGKYFGGLYNGGTYDLRLTSKEGAATYYHDQLDDWLSRMIDAGMLVKEYLPASKYRVFIRGENREKLFYGQLWGKKGFWPEEYIKGMYGHSEGTCFVITWDSTEDIPSWLRGRECSTDNSVGFMYYERTA